jgi:prolyl 4-hydroxylase
MDAPTEIHPGIFLVNDFLSQEERDAIIALCEPITDEEWDRRLKSAFGINDLPFAAELEDRLYEIFDETQYAVRSFNKIQRREPGEVTDIQPHYARKYEDERCLFGVTVTVNDDYEGGELDFVGQGFTIKPPAGSLIYFPSTEDYAFKINYVTGDVHRYSIPEQVYVVEPDRPRIR